MLIDTESEDYDIWPQLVVRAYAKCMVNYERIVNQTPQNFLRDLIGKPVRDYSVGDLDWEFIRLCFTRKYLFIAKALPWFVEKCCPEGHDLPMFCYLNHALDISFTDKDGIKVTKKWIQLKVYSHQVEKPVKFDIMSKLLIDEDWKLER
jgi:hypothetical protein